MATKSFIEKYTIENGYHTQAENYYGRVKMTLGNSIPELEEGASVLDMGCSRGWTTVELANLYPDSHVIGIDIWIVYIEDALEN